MSNARDISELDGAAFGKIITADIRARVAMDPLRSDGGAVKAPSFPRGAKQVASSHAFPRRLVCQSIPRKHELIYTVVSWAALRNNEA